MANVPRHQKVPGYPETAPAEGGVFACGGAVWIRDVHRAHRVAAKLRGGKARLSAYRRRAPNVLFGDSGDSGLRRTNGLDAPIDYTGNKSAWVELTGATSDPFQLG